MLGARGEIRASNKPGLKSAASSKLGYTRKLISEIGTRERIRTSKTEGLSFRCLPDCITRASALPISNCRFPIYSLNQGSRRNTSIGNRQLAIDNVEWYRRR